MSLTWKTTVKVIETDFETLNRQKRLAEFQRVDWFVAATWGVVGLIVLTWVRILYLYVAVPVLSWLR